MLFWLVCAWCIIGLAAGVWFYRRRAVAPRPAVESEPVRVQPYHSVSIEPGKDSCRDVRLLGDQRFLAHEAPRLPLPECGALTCRCRYIHYDDRREHERRSVYGAARAANWLTAQVDRRALHDRRSGGGTGLPSAWFQ